jgi:hypothetical protein
LLCKLCGEKRANPKHVQSHGLAYDEYLQKYEPEYYYVNLATEAINDLYVSVRHKFIQMAVKDKKVYWRTVKKGEDRDKYGLIDKDIKDHFEGKSTLGVFTPERKTKFISFDIDIMDKQVLERVYDALNSYIPEKYIHCSWSGNKGYHIDIFFDRLIDKSIVGSFYKVILNDTGYPPNVVECRGHNQQAVKIPLGFNHKNKDPKTDFCFFCNKYGVEINDGFYGRKYISEIKKLPADVLCNAVEMNYVPDILTDEETIEGDELQGSTQPLAIYQGNEETKRESIEKLIANGIYQEGERHQSMFKVAVYLKEKGYSIEENKTFLNEWIEKKCNPDLFSSTPEEIQNDIQYTVDCVYRNDYKLKAKAKKIVLTKLELKNILSVTNKTLRKLYFILYTHCKAFGDENATFYMTYEQMGQAGANKGDRRALKQQIDRLGELGLIEVVQRNTRAEKSLKHKPNYYKVRALETGITVEVNEPVFSPCKLVSNNCMDCTSCHLLNDKEIKQVYKKDAKGIKIASKRKCKKDNLLV